MRVGVRSAGDCGVVVVDDVTLVVLVGVASAEDCEMVVVVVVVTLVVVVVVVMFVAAFASFGGRPRPRGLGAKMELDAGRATCGGCGTVDGGVRLGVHQRCQICAVCYVEKEYREEC